MTGMKRTADIDSLVARYGGVYEHSPWIARQTFEAGTLPADPFVSREQAQALAGAMARTLMQASDQKKLALIRAHPDLVGRAALAGELTTESTDEQASAGLDHCSADELTRFQAANLAYHERFGFPFVLAVRGRDRAAILDVFEQRLKNDVQTEFNTALDEINKIALLRLEMLVSVNNRSVSH